MHRGPDVVLVLADQWRGQDQGWIGNDEVRTPHLDALAARGVAVEGAIANHPVCTPSRGDLLTGTHPHHHRAIANDIPIDPEVPTWAEILRTAGYRTQWIGKWHLDGPERDAPVPTGTAGFATFASTSCSHDYLDGHYYLSEPERSPRRVDFTGYEPEVQTELALAALAAPSDEPACVVVSYGPPHNPYPDVPRRYLDRYDPDALTLRANVPVADDDATAEERVRLAQYYAGITAVDEQLGRLVADLTERGRLDDTLLIVTADHGDMLGSHGRTAKQVPYAEAVRVPLVLHWPAGLPARRLARSDGLVGIVDLAPTVLDLLGLPALPNADGQSVAEGLRTGEGMPQRALIGNQVSVDEGWRQGVGEWRGFVDTTSTYARRVDGQPWLLFDDLADPEQLDNLVAATERVVAADAVLAGLLAASDDPGGDGAAMLRHVDRVAEWNARERQQHREQARLLPTRSAAS